MDASDPSPSSTGDLDGLPIPPLDPTYFAQQHHHHMTDRGNDAVDGFSIDTDFMIDDLDFDLSFDDFLLNNAPVDPLLNNPNYCLGSDPGHADPIFFDQPGAALIGGFKSTPEDWTGSGRLSPHCSGQSQNKKKFKSTYSELGKFGGGQAVGVVMVADTSSPEVRQSSSGSGITSPSMQQVSGYLNVPSPESNGSNDNKGLMSCHSPESESSGNCGSNDTNQSVRSSPNFGNNTIKSGVAEQELKLEGVNANNISKCSSLLKRKKGSEDSNNNVSKQKKSASVVLSDTVNNVDNEEDEKRKARLIRNRESAQLSRQRKKHYVEELEDKVRVMHSTIQDLNAKINYIVAENATLRTQLGDNGAPLQVPPPPPGMYPHPPVMYPWMPYAPPYMMKSQGLQVPLVPIPKLKSQAAASAPKSSKKVEKKRTEVKTKKVASVSFIGLLFFMLLFGGLVPLVNVRYGGVTEPFMSGNSFGSGLYEKHHGRVLTVDGPVNGTGYSGIYSGKDYCLHCGRRGQGENDQTNTSKAADDSFRVGNGSDPLAASLYVPRNDKLVQIDGNLIIHSVLASEKAMASHEHANKNNRETGLTVPGDLAPAILGSHPLGTGEKEDAKSIMQQWFLEGIAGPLLSSGMCTEVFQFDVSSSVSGAIVPATTARNLTVEMRQNATRVNKHRNRRILNSPPVSLSRPSHNTSEEQSGRTGKQENFTGNKSSMVVSVLVDPREAGDANGDGMMGPKSLSRIFVVVLIDSVKYVTYSCMLPFKGSVPLVTT